MLNKHCFEAFDRTMNDIMKMQGHGATHVLFGGKVVVFGGGFRQILSVIPKGSRSDIVSSTVNQSYLWKSCEVLKLTKNMRLSQCETSQSRDEIKEFGDWILKLGDGMLVSVNKGSDEALVPSDLLLHGVENPLEKLIEFTYPDLIQALRQKKLFIF